jgi:hypothetical protein
MRPSSLSETARRIINGHPSPSPISEFLDEFYNARDDLPRRMSMLSEEPHLTGDSHTDALLGAIAEYLSHRYGLPRAPAWASAPCRFLQEPWFTVANAVALDDELRDYLRRESPPAFARRNIWTDARPLRRASAREADPD